MDLVFLEVVEFTLFIPEWLLCRIAPSQEEALRAAMALVGIELLDYGCFTVRELGPPTGRVLVSAYSKAWREKAERATASRFG